ncbi:M28 family peptidase [Schlesneria paludicola]|uniref:M28 family peptidase n=1 Tax=Schlesneria paludicola TaxID=360056 RepID=UPI0002E8EEC7|nr:M28 family peptidase [Schlesneria paludicola]
MSDSAFSDEDQKNQLGRSAVIRLAGEGFQGVLPEMSPAEVELSSSLRKSVEKLATEIGERNLRRYGSLKGAADWIEGSLKDCGYEIERQSYEVDGQVCDNLIFERVGSTLSKEIVIVTAHYDSVFRCPGANDNGSGTAALVDLAKRFAKCEPKRTLRLLFCVNEEPPMFQTDSMGSVVYARRCKERRENIEAVLSLETIGYYSDEEGSQQYPFPLGAVFPRTGNFIGFVGNIESGPLVHRVLSSFRKHAQFPSEATSLPGDMEGVGWSDQWAFWKFGYPGVMVTDTAPFRYPHYHKATDTPDKLDYDRMARVVTGLEKVITELINPSGG